MKYFTLIFIALIAKILCVITPDCTTYCTNITANCVGANIQYADMATCMKTCAALPLGVDASGAETTNTIGCREYHAGTPSMSAPATHCPHAGPSGGNLCGGATSTCQAYCSIVMSACTGANSFFSSAAICMASCQGFNTSGTVADVSGPTAFCHLYHAGAALTDPTTHCPHASPSGVGVCGTRCENYCNINLFNCPGALTPYADYATCMGFCAILPAGNVTDQAGNTVDCRIYHESAAVALNDTATHCPHASFNGGNVCGSYCQVYCQVAMNDCTGSNSLYADTPTCMTACAALATTGTLGSVSGNNVQCRIYHLGAATVLSLPATHCPHGGPSGGGVCVSGTSGTGTGTGTGTGSGTGTGTGTGTGSAFGLVISFVTLMGLLLF